MKMKALLALGLCLALTIPLLAQEENKEVDSVYITPFAGARIILVGKGMEKLLKENNLEVLKNKFIQDYQESAKDKDFPATVKNIIYLADADGKRRLKAIPDEVAPVDVKAEIKAFRSNLPPFHYTIYDLMKDYQYHIYLNNPEDLDSLEKVNSNSIIGAALTLWGERKYRQYNNIEIKQRPTGEYFVSSFGGQTANTVLEITPQFGLGVINTVISPTAGFTVSLNIHNRYGVPKHEIGVGSNFYILADYANKTFSNFYPVNSYNLYYMRQFGKSGFGITTLIFRDSKRKDGVAEGSLHKAWGFGFLTQYDRFKLEYNYIYDKRKNTSLAFTFRYFF